MSVRAVRHAGIVVSDADRSLVFYRDLLGLQVEVDQVESGDFIEKLLGVPDVRVRTVKLSAPEGPTLVELLEFQDSGRPARAVGDLRLVGPTHTALTVDGIDALHRRLADAGVQFISPPLISADGRARVAFCADPDGAMLELVEPLGT